jgi:hypothetical protein
MISQYFIGRMMADSANPMHQPQTIIEIRPFRGGWQCYEDPGVQPYWTGEHAKEDAIGYATGRAQFRRGEIRVLDNAGEVERVISFDQTENGERSNSLLSFGRWETVRPVLDNKTVEKLLLTSGMG